MFWELERVATEHRGVYDSASSRFVSYARLLQEVTELERDLRQDDKALVLLFSDNSAASIAAYLAVLRAGHTVMLGSATADPLLQQRLLEAYSPDIILHVDDQAKLYTGYRPASTRITRVSMHKAIRPAGSWVNPETAILLSTSGSTGSPKAVRLSYRNIDSNAESITAYLGIDSNDIAITSLPMSYSYGLSVVNSHLAKGASLVCTNSSILSPDFWNVFSEQKCTSFAGVPASYAMLERIGIDNMKLPSLRMMTQAGGRLPGERVRLFADIAKRSGLAFYVMYGQTEASPRISYVPPARLAEKPTSIGIPIPGGKLSLALGDGSVTAGGAGEIVYEGPNVMLGYATSRHALSKGDELNGRLHTGDVGYADEDGYFYITGRLKRFIKIAGLRINLDDVENMLESTLLVPVACVGTDDLMQIVVESSDKPKSREALRRVLELYRLHHSFVRAHDMSALPLNASGKKDYAAISSAIG